MPTNWKIQVDWDRDDDFTTTGDDITDYVINFTSFLGQKDPYKSIADNATLVLTVKNSDKRFSPENASSPLHGKLVPLRPLRIVANDTTIWRGWLEAVKPAPGKYGERVAHIEAHGAIPFYLDQETKITLQENKRTDEVIEELIDEVIIPPGVTDIWILGRTGHCELGETTTLRSAHYYADLDEGIRTLDLAAHNWVQQGGYKDEDEDGFDVFRAIYAIAEAERGKFLFNREGKVMFWNRHHLLDIPASCDVSLNDDMVGLEYVFSGIDQMKNEVVVTCHPYEISTDTDIVLWEMNEDQVLSIDKDAEYEFEVRYTDPDNADLRCGGRNVSYSDLEVDDKYASIYDLDITLDAGATSAKFTITNSNLKRAAQITSLKLKGQRVLDHGQIDVRETNEDSLTKYHRRALRLNLPSVASEKEAENIARFEANRRGDPLGDVLHVKLVSHLIAGGNQHSQQIARTLGDSVQIEETQTGHNRKYWIIGEQHSVNVVSGAFETTWFLEPCPATTYWTLNDSLLNADTVLAY